MYQQGWNEAIDSVIELVNKKPKNTLYNWDKVPQEVQYLSTLRTTDDNGDTRYYVQAYLREPEKAICEDGSFFYYLGVKESYFIKGIKPIKKFKSVSETLERRPSIKCE